MRSLFSITDLSVEEIQSLIDTANQIIEDPDRFAHVCDRDQLVDLFDGQIGNIHQIHHYFAPFTAR